jgi:hypothetical protein
MLAASQKFRNGSFNIKFFSSGSPFINDMVSHIMSTSLMMQLFNTNGRLPSRTYISTAPFPLHGSKYISQHLDIEL